MGRCPAAAHKGLQRLLTLADRGPAERPRGLPPRGRFLVPYTLRELRSNKLEPLVGPLVPMQLRGPLGGKLGGSEWTGLARAWIRLGLLFSQES